MYIKYYIQNYITGRVTNIASMFEISNKINAQLYTQNINSVNYIFIYWDSSIKLKKNNYSLFQLFM